MPDVVVAAPQPRVPVQGTGLPPDSQFPVHRIYCVGRNFAEHAREMGAAAPASAAERGNPTFFLKPADAIVTDGAVVYPPGTRELHHEVELVVALGRGAPAGGIATADAMSLVYGYAVGLDLTRRDLQAAAKAKSLPWDTGKSFEHAAPIGAIVPAAELGALDAHALTLRVNGEVRQHGALSDLIWNVADIIHALSKLYALRAGDLIFMGTPAGVGPLLPGDSVEARLDAGDGRMALVLHGRILPAIASV
ncbi:fumarylacetoacetate hydrolase family protein [Lysobacter solisilvae (ex Woo and Kim 2020)]|uniref:Fumarylacetoacetate hydrolase family protein n=1 Tax=Agrilutibacter terrestris TaxID=2865112 RepID=A0A7H0FUT5_9GAMM|nr:fumarylacetoacetate hydrolase family protein [Lysobacter terrestris]QNP39801.1 fumarylacetoacetate hydrolase family protein [Lysobacter terrestris]